MASPYGELLERLRQAAVFSSVSELLSWDQETMMPGKAGRFRAEEHAALSTLAHERATDPRIGDLLDQCEADSNLT